MSESVVQKYFRDQQSSLFHWADHGRELCWLDGTTIAFHDELVVVLNRLSMGCLPGFSSIIVAMAATRATWPDVSARMSRMVRALQNSELPSYAEAMRKHQFLTDTWPSSSRKLNLLSAFAQSVVPKPEGRAELLSTLFDHFESGYTAVEQQVISTAFEVGLPDDWYFERKGDGEPLTLPSDDREEDEWRRRPPIFHRVLHDVLDFLRVARVLASSLQDYSADDLKQRVATGVAVEIVAPEEAPLDDPQSAAALLESLKDDPELSGFAQLTRHLMAAVTLPRSLEVAQEIPAGGISDISNRGQLDKLLLSELAFDDLTMAVRIASNEAMYMRRESPPNPRAQSRMVLVDNSLPMWGIPRLYGTAMALALNAGGGKKLSIECFRPHKDTVVPVPLATRDDVSEQLSSLEPTEHPGMALPAFHDAIQSADDEAAEPVLITTSDTLQSPAFRFALERSSLPGVWIITVERDGQLTVMQRTRQGTSVRKRIHLPLEDILSRKDTSLRRTDLADEMPEILRREEFPLRLSHQTRRGRVFLWNNAVLSVSDDGRLMYWSEQKFGARQLCSDLPRRSGELQLIDRNATQIQIYIPGDRPEIVTLYQLGLQIHRAHAADGLDSVTDVSAIGSTLLVFGQKCSDHGTDHQNLVVALDRITGKRLCSRSLVGMDHRIGRCVQIENVWHVLYFDGTGIIHQEMPAEYQDANHVAELLTGDFIMIKNGEVRDPQNLSRFQMFANHPRNVIALSKHRPGAKRIGIAVNDQVSDRHAFLNLETGEAEFTKGGWQGVVDFELQESRHFIHPRTPHWRFGRIGLDARDGKLWLQSSQGGYSVITLNTSQKQIELISSVRPSSADVSFSAVQDTPGPPGVGYRLRVAEWDNGAKAWLDSRGLLHLRSKDPHAPQVTISLRDGCLSGWLSTGEIFGDNYYFGPPNEQNGVRRVTAEIAWETGLQPFISVVPWSYHYIFNTAEARGTKLRES